MGLGICEDCGRNGGHTGHCPRLKRLVSKSALALGLDCLDGVEVTKIFKYRSDFTGIDNDYNRAKVEIDLKFPEHLKLYYKLKGMAD